MDYLNNDRVIIKHELPLASLVLDFYDRLKSTTSGYASLSYDFLEYRIGDLVKLDIMVNREVIDALANIVHRSESAGLGKMIAKRLKNLIPRAQFEIPIQAAIGAKIVARETIAAYRKDVTAKLYGGDVTRKNKLLNKQKAGKKRMKQIGNVSIPQKAFLAVLQKDED